MSTPELDLLAYNQYEDMLDREQEETRICRGCGKEFQVHPDSPERTCPYSWTCREAEITGVRFRSLDPRDATLEPAALGCPWRRFRRVKMKNLVKRRRT